MILIGALSHQGPHSTVGRTPVCRSRVGGGITGQQIAAAATGVLGREVSYQEAEVSTRDYVEAFPISDAHKDIYAELFDYFRSSTYLGDPEPIIETLDGFEPRGLEDFLRDELFAGN